MDIGVLLQAAVISAVVSGLFSFFSQGRKNKIDCITKEREKWRENLRREIPKIISKCSLPNGDMCISCLEGQEKEEIIEKLSFYRLSINPADKADKKLRVVINRLLRGETIKRSVFLGKSCRLLKREWEKGKLEASGLKEKNIFVFCILVLSSIIIILKKYDNLTCTIQPSKIILFINLVTAFVFLPYYLHKSEEKLNNKAHKNNCILSCFKKN